MTRFLQSTDALLRGRSRPGDAASDAPRAAGLAQLVLIVALFGLLYGGTMGTFGGFRGERALQLLYSGAKVPLLLLVTFALSLPSFFVLNTLMGLRDDFPRVVRALIATQAGLTVILASLAPLVGLWYVSFRDYNAAQLFNLIMFAVASLAAQWMLRRSYRPLIARNPRHLWMLRTWLVIYAIVGIQMAWVLRPFVGDPRSPTRYFRADAWGNAYVEVAVRAGKALGW